LFNLRAGAAFATAQKIAENAQYNVLEITIAAGKVSTQAKAILRTVESCNRSAVLAQMLSRPKLIQSCGVSASFLVQKR
jgi:purine nucleoside permease